MKTRYVENLKDAVAASSAPYGYTLTVWCSGAISIHSLGLPSPHHVFLFLVGGVAAFLAVEAIAYGTLRVRLIRADPVTVAVWGNAHLLTAGIAVACVWASAELVGGTAAWPLNGFVATAVYLLLNSLQLTLAAAAEEATHTPAPPATPMPPAPGARPPGTSR